MTPTQRPSPPSNPPPDEAASRKSDAGHGGPTAARTGGWIGGLLVALSLLLVGALFGATWAGRITRAPPTLLTSIVTVLPYVYGGVLAVLFAVWSAIPDRRTPPVLIALTAAVAAVLWGPAFPAWPEPQAGAELRVLTWNVRRLWGGPNDGGDPAACVIDVLREAHADVVSLQEVTARDAQRLEQELGLQCVQIDYLGTGEPTAGGVAACVRPDGWDFRSGSQARFVPDRAWRYAFLELERDERIINVLAVHLEPYRLAAGGLQHAASVSAAQGDQSAELLRRVTRFRDPTVLAGDFNSTRDAALHVALRGLLRDAFEIGGRGFGPTFFLFDRIPIRIDYIYVTREFAVQTSRVLPVDCSDHRPLLTDLALVPER